MQLDNAHIAIRERTLLEVMDLALHVLRDRPAALLLTVTLGAAPFALLNAWLLGSWDNIDIDFEGQSGYLFWMMILVTLEAPLAAAPTTLYLGQVTFHNSLNIRRLFGDLWRGLPQMFWYQVVVRALCLPFLITWILPYALWPYLSEVVLLERNPMFRGEQKRMTSYRRSKMLHGGSSGDLFGYWLLSGFLGAVVVVALWTAIWSVSSLLFGGLSLFFDEINSLYLSAAVVFPIALWLVFGYFAVVRFLMYLDLRIRREGWEVELAIRAQARRLFEETPA